MDCPEARQEFSALLDGELTQDERAAVERHLSECSDCLRDLDKFKRVDVLYRRMAPQQAPAGFERRVHAAIRKETFRFSVRQWRPMALWPVLAAAAVFLVVGGIALMRVQTPGARFDVAKGLDRGVEPQASPGAKAEAAASSRAALDSVDEDIKEQLHALGYLGGGAQEHPAAPEEPAKPAAPPRAQAVAGAATVSSDDDLRNGTVQKASPSLDASAGRAREAVDVVAFQAPPEPVSPPREEVMDMRVPHRGIPETKGGAPETSNEVAGDRVTSHPRARTEGGEAGALGAEETQGSAQKGLGESLAFVPLPSEAPVAGEASRTSEGAPPLVPSQADTRDGSSAYFGRRTTAAEKRVAKEKLSAGIVVGAEHQGAPAPVPPAPVQSEAAASPPPPALKRESPAPAPQIVGERIFTWRDGVWREQGYAGEEAVSLVRGSESMQTLLKQHAELEGVLKVGARVIFKLEHTWYEVTPQAEQQP